MGVDKEDFRLYRLNSILPTSSKVFQRVLKNSLLGYNIKFLYWQTINFVTRKNVKPMMLSWLLIKIIFFFVISSTKILKEPNSRFRNKRFASVQKDFCKNCFSGELGKKIWYCVCVKKFPLLLNICCCW